MRRSEHGSWHRWASQEMRAALLILSATWMTCRDIILFALTNVSSATTCPLRTSNVLRRRLAMVADVLVAHANLLAGVFRCNVSATIHASVWHTNDGIRAYESCLRHGLPIVAPPLRSATHADCIRMNQVCAAQLYVSQQVKSRGEEC